MQLRRILHISLLFVLVPSSAWAWGRRGHSMVCETAAYLVSSEPKADFLKDQSFMLGYYCNIPDFLWKGPATVNQERPQHFMDIEIFERNLKGTDVKAPYALDRSTFERKFPQVPFMAGRAWWRVREMDEILMADRAKLMDPKLTKHDERFNVQGDWVMHAGLMGHYIGDLSMPLHVTENHDGAMTNQKGIHSFFEDVVVNYLVHGPDGFDLDAAVWKEASKRWKADRKKLEKMSILELLQAESEESGHAVSELLKIDRQVGRADLKKAALAFKPMIVKRLAAGSVYLAEYYRRAIGFDFDQVKFFEFRPSPVYIKPAK